MVSAPFSGYILNTFYQFLARKQHGIPINGLSGQPKQSILGMRTMPHEKPMLTLNDAPDWTAYPVM
jgi:hypothetical protein